MNSWAISAIDEDRFCEKIFEQLNEKGVNLYHGDGSLSNRNRAGEAVANGCTTFAIKSGVAWVNLPFTPRIEEPVRKTCTVSFDSLAKRNVMSCNSIDAFLDAMPRDKAPCIVFDVNQRQKFYTPECLENSMEPVTF